MKLCLFCLFEIVCQRSWVFACLVYHQHRKYDKEKIKSPQTLLNLYQILSSEVCELMMLQVVSSLKWFPTDLTTIWFHSRMQFTMSSAWRRVTELYLACVTTVRFLSSMDSIMIVQLGREVKHLCTITTKVFFVTLLEDLFQCLWKRQNTQMREIPGHVHVFESSNF